MDFLAALGLFAAKVLLVVMGVGFIVALIGSAARRGGPAPGDVKLTHLSALWRRTARRMNGQLLTPRAAKRVTQKARAEEKAALKRQDERPRVFVLTFDGNVRASQTRLLREEVKAILEISRPGDEVVVRLHSPGGFVHAYGFAANQLERIKERGLKLTAAVDQVAASGGYMMAVVADHIVAAPFAMIGSIGVVAGIPNFSRWLKKHDVDYELHTAGPFKRSLTVLGENTEEGRRRFKDELEVAHGLFKRFVAKHRPKLDLERVATGQHWYGAEAVELGLIDALKTSDDYLLERRDTAEVWAVQYTPRRRPFDRAVTVLAEGLGRAAEAGVAGGLVRGVEQARESLSTPR